ncbi:hypothetical protein [Rivularia sp. PCC 7116]|uniref:hypothetical protein n=1 Tax=Rivularia sp. PCC 7116 TaxID=373994 RepID=UPI0002E3A722|nr:hypothetical protein [Rivularia sp. PCC 7116]
MNLKTKRRSIVGVVLGGAALASMLGGMIFADSAVAQKSSLKRHRRCYTYTLLNRTNRGIDYNVGRRKAYIPAKGIRRLRRCFRRRRVYHPVVKFDRIIGSGYKLTRVRLRPGRNGFDRKGRILILTTGTVANGPVPNSLPVPNRVNLD